MSQTYVITGANRGIGLEFARQLVEADRQVIATARDPGRAAELAATGAEVHALDVGDSASVSAFAAELSDRPVDVLINNAGIGVGHGDFEGLDIDAVDRFFQINSLGPLRVIQALLPNLRAGGAKKVAQITSKVGSVEDNSGGGMYGYRASKAALNMFNKSLSLDLAGEGLIFTLLHPGWVQTDMGGPGAPLSVQDSVRGLLDVIAGLGPADSGTFLDFRREPIPW